MFMGSLPLSKSLSLFVASLITIFGIGCFGHFINDWCDIEVDKKAGKENRFAAFASWQRVAIVAGALILALLPWLFLPFDRSSIVLLVLEFLLLLSYAIPPLRLKERTFLAVIADAAYAYAIPAVLAAHTFFLATEGLYDSTFIITLFAWQLLLGIRHFLNHVALDRLNDLASHTLTVATINGNYYVHRLIRNLILPLEVLSFSAFLGNFSRYNAVLVVVCVVLFIVLSSFTVIIAIGRDYSFFSYRFSSIFLDTYYQSILPFIPLLFLIFLDARFLILLAVHLLLFYNGFGKVVVGLPVYLASNVLPKRVANTDNEVTTVSSPIPAKDPSRLNIAVVNINKAKYTETFIDESIHRLNYNIYYLHGDTLPTHDDQTRHFLSNLHFLHAWASFLESLLGLGNKHFLKRSITAYLQARNIRLVLAEFGPVGAQMLPLTREVGIPLIVYFHGYDVFHKPTWKTHSSDYQALFQEAEKIVVVSTLMRERLIESGAPCEKLVHLPAFVNLELFSCRDHSTLPPRFVAVGRFAETKSPHLTILAFRKVVDVVPEATLSMIGKAGGGELFEACLILVRALGLEDKVLFKGVVSHDAVAEELRNARVFVQHSVTTPENQDMEGKPVAIMEAMASGMPVIATRHSGIPELITDGVDGLLVEEYDVEAMAQAMIRVARNDELVQMLGRNASERIRSDSLIRDHVQILEGVIEECLGSTA
jgi:glycosyltransferase involved in cell wall biosynthesis